MHFPFLRVTKHSDIIKNTVFAKKGDKHLFGACHPSSFPFDQLIADECDIERDGNVNEVWKAMMFLFEYYVDRIAKKGCNNDSVFWKGYFFQTWNFNRADH